MAVTIIDGKGRVLDSPFLVGYRKRVPMALTQVVDVSRQGINKNTIFADRRIYATADGRLVERDHPERHVLVAPEGGPLSQEMIDRYGLSVQGGKIIQGSAIEEASEEALGEEPVAAETEASAVDPDEDDLTSLTVDELKKVARDEQIGLSGITKKDDIIEAIRAAREADDGTGDGSSDTL